MRHSAAGGRGLCGLRPNIIRPVCWPQPASVVSKKCDVKRRTKDRLFGATEADEGRPLGAGWQRQASNQVVRLEFKRLRS